MRPLSSSLAAMPRVVPIKSKFDCEQCPGWCCSYAVIPVNDKDLARLAKHFGLSLEQAAARYTKRIAGERGLRHRTDTVYKSMCMLFDQENRRCGAYNARPEICRTYPSGPRCGYYEFLMFERDQHDDPDFVPH